MRVGDWLVEPDLLRLSRDGVVRRVEPKIMELLVLLADRAPGLVPRAEIFEVVWEGRAVVDAALSRAVSLLRQALEDDAHNPRYVETIATKGYRLIASVERLETEERPPVSNSGPSVPTEPEIVEAKGSASSAPRRRQHRYPLRWTLPTALAIVALAFAGISLLREARSPPANAAPAGIIRSMAVLPFSDLSSDAADQYFAAGLTEALITRLSRLSELRVISTTSAETFRGTNRPPTEIAKDLGVEAVLEGSVVQSQDRVRVYVQLVATETGEYLWTQEYDRELSDILYLHAAIGQAVADAVRLRLTPREVSALAHSGSVDSEAYRLYLRGRFHWNRRTIADLERSLEHFQQALDLDPTFAPAQAGLADTYVLLSTYYALTPAEAFPPARAAAERALVLDPDLPEAYASLGAVHLSFDWDFSAAGDAYRRALELGPGYATAHQWHAELLSILGRHEEAVAEGRRAWELDPLSPIINAALGQRLNAAGRWEEALEQFGQALELEPRFAWIRREMAYAETRLGRSDRALAERLREMEARGIEPELLAELREAINDDGMKGFWRWELARLERQAAASFVPALLYAEALEGTGDREEALVYLGRAAAERGDHVLQLTTSPELMELVQDPRAQTLLANVGLGHLVAR